MNFVVYEHILLSKYKCTCSNMVYNALTLHGNQMIGQVILTLFVHSAFITMKAKTNMLKIALATTDGVITRYGSPTQIELELIM